MKCLTKITNNPTQILKLRLGLLCPQPKQNKYGEMFLNFKCTVLKRPLCVNVSNYINA